MRYIPGRISLNEIFVSLLACHDGDQVTFLNSEGSEFLGFTVETGLDAVYIYSSGFVDEVEVTVGLKIEFLVYAARSCACAVGNDTSEPVPYVSPFVSCEEFCSSYSLYMIEFLKVTNDFIGAVVRGLVTDDGNDVALVEDS